MATDTEPGKAGYATLWQALCWLAYNDFDAHTPDGDGSLHQDLKLVLDTSGHKASLLEAVRDGKVSFEGRLGEHCDPPPSPGDTWREYHRTGHSADYSPIEPKDWPSPYNDLAIGWNSSALLTPRGKFIDVRASRVIMCAWHPGPASQVVRRQIPLANQALEEGHQALEKDDDLSPSPPQKKERNPRGAGRKKGSGSFEKEDEHLLKKMKLLVTAGASDWDAALTVVDDALGKGTDESRAKRLLARYKKQEEKNTV